MHVLIFYLQLQVKMLNRQLKDFGIQPVVGYFLVLVVFSGLSAFLFSKSAYAEFIYIAVAFGILFRLNQTGRNRFLRTVFKYRQYYFIRMSENMLVISLFIVILLIHSAFMMASLLVIVSLSMVFLRFNPVQSYSIPTPFRKHPFEFIIGFRNTIYLIFFAYFLTIMAVTAANFNLGIFALLLILLLCMSFYAEPEDMYFVWVFSQTSTKFLLIKILTALAFSTLLCLPVSISLMVFYPENMIAVAGFQIIGSLYLIAMILSKYAAFPEKINLPQILLIALSVSFPPLLIGIIPYFYSKSITRLNEILK